MGGDPYKEMGLHPKIHSRTGKAVIRTSFVPPLPKGRFYPLDPEVSHNARPARMGKEVQREGA